MSNSTVKIGRVVDYETLESALLAAAEDVGLRARVEDKFNKNYELGSVRESQEYKRTDVFLRGKFLPAFELTVHGKGSTDHFSVQSGFLFGFAREGEIREYLSAVSNHLGD